MEIVKCSVHCLMETYDQCLVFISCYLYDLYIFTVFRNIYIFYLLCIFKAIPIEQIKMPYKVMIWTYWEYGHLLEKNGVHNHWTPVPETYFSRGRLKPLCGKKIILFFYRTAKMLFMFCSLWEELEYGFLSLLGGLKGPNLIFH